MQVEKQKMLYLLNHQLCLMPKTINKRYTSWHACVFKKDDQYLIQNNIVTKKLQIILFNQKYSLESLVPNIIECNYTKSHDSFGQKTKMDPQCMGKTMTRSKPNSL